MEDKFKEKVVKASLTKIERSKIVNCDSCGGTGYFHNRRCFKCTSRVGAKNPLPLGKIRANRLYTTVAVDLLAKIYIKGKSIEEVMNYIDSTYTKKGEEIKELMRDILRRD